MSQKVTTKDFLTFSVNNYQFACPIINIREVISLNTKEKNNNSITWNHFDVKLAHFSKLLGYSPNHTPSSESFALVLEIFHFNENYKQALIVDQVHSVLSINLNNIQPLFLPSVHNFPTYINGALKTKSGFIFTINPNKLSPDALNAPIATAPV